MKQIKLILILLFATENCVIAQGSGGMYWWLIPFLIITQTKANTSLQTDFLVPQSDSQIGADKGDYALLNNTYAELQLYNDVWSAGLRAEFLKYPLPGYENSFKGAGVPYWFFKLNTTDVLALTGGCFYDQFGSGFILRLYEDRPLGIDNNIRGVHLKLTPSDWLAIKAFTGKQRKYWERNKAQLTGADVEITLSDQSSLLSDRNATLVLGGSWVNKRERTEDIYVDATHKVNVPLYVNAFDVRTQLYTPSVSVLLEYAKKTDDPSFDNGYTFQKGQATMLSVSYTGSRAFTLLMQAKRSFDMSFRSSRSTTLNSSFINHLPAFTHDHTYALASLYPYATQLSVGEWATQVEASYRFKRGSLLCGDDAMLLSANFSHVHSIDKNTDNVKMGGSIDEGKFFSWGDETYYQDIDVTLFRSIKHTNGLSVMYMNQRYNKTVVEGEGGMVKSNIFVVDGRFSLSDRLRLRCELQHLDTHNDTGDWEFALAELSVAPYLMFTISDMYNSGSTHTHYYQGLVSYSNDSHRLQVGYGRTRAGFNCSGGVCRYVPACKGFTLTYNYNFSM